MMSSLKFIWHDIYGSNPLSNPFQKKKKFLVKSINNIYWEDKKEKKRGEEFCSVNGLHRILGNRTQSLDGTGKLVRDC